jgi:hypothetical protein
MSIDLDPYCISQAEFDNNILTWSKVINNPQQRTVECGIDYVKIWLARSRNIDEDHPKTVNQTLYPLNINHLLNCDVILSDSNRLRGDIWVCKFIIGSSDNAVQIALFTKTADGTVNLMQESHFWEPENAANDLDYKPAFLIGFYLASIMQPVGYVLK